MPIPDPILSPLVETIFNSVLAQSGAADWVREKLGRDPTKRAYGRALNRAITMLAVQHPDAEDRLFDASFLQHEAASILAQFLLRDGRPDPAILAQRWADSLAIHDDERRAVLNRQLMSVAADFLALLGQALKAEPDLVEINDSRTFERIADDLAALRRAFKAEQTTPDTRIRYLRWLIERNLYLDPRGTFQAQRQVQVKLDEVYISLQAQRGETSGVLDRSILEQELADLEVRLARMAIPAEEAEDQREHLLAHLSGREMGAPTARPGAILELSVAVTRHERLVVLGEPGSGKTTLTRYLALKHAQALYHGHSDAGDGLGVARFPILIRIADYAESDTWKTTSLSDFLLTHCKINECPSDGLAALLHAELERGSALILLDGLDEIVSADARRDIVRRIEDFVRRHESNGNRFIVTSRIAGYRNFPLSEAFAHYTVREMSKVQMRRFLEKWCPAVEAAQTPDLSPERRNEVARREIEGIMMAIERTHGVRRMAANPLLLRVLALIYRTGARLPQKRIELYKLAADTLAREWRLAQGVPEAALVLLDDSNLTRLLGKLAYWLHVNKSTGLATEREVKAVLGAEWARINRLMWDADDPDMEIITKVEQFLRAVHVHTGLFVERAPKRYGFMHLTFQEYYVARYLVARSKTRAQLIRQHLHDPRWDEPILLALGFVGLDMAEDASELVESAILVQGEDAEEHGFIPSPYEHLLSRDFLFALRCLGDDIPVDLRLTHQLIERFVDEFVRRRGSGRYLQYRHLLDGLFDRLRETKITPLLATYLSATFDDPDVWVRLEAVRLLVELDQHPPELLSVLTSLLDTADDRVRWEAAHLLAELRYETLDVLAILQGGLAIPDRWVQIQSARHLIACGHHAPDALSVMITALGESDQDLLVEAVVTLSELGNQFPDRVLPALFQTLSIVDGYVPPQTLTTFMALAQDNLDVVIPIARNTLQTADGEVQKYVIEILGQVQQPTSEVLEILSTALNNPNVRIRMRAAHGLIQFGHRTSEAMAELIWAVKDDPSAFQLDISNILGQVHKQAPDMVQTALLDALRNEDDAVRFKIAQHLHTLGYSAPPTISVFAEALHSVDSWVRVEAAKILIALGHEVSDAEATLTAALEDENVWWRLSAAIILIDLGPQMPAARHVLNTILSDTDSWLRFFAASILAEQGLPTSEIIQALMSVLGETNTLEQSESKRLLTSWSQQWPDVVLPFLLPVLSEPDRPERAQVVEILVASGQRPPGLVAMAVDRLLIETDPQIRKDLAKFLGESPSLDNVIIETLYAGLLDKNNQVRTACAEALARLGRRFQTVGKTITKKLEHAISDSAFDSPDLVEERTGHDYAFDALWMLVAGEETNDQGFDNDSSDLTPLYTVNLKAL